MRPSHLYAAEAPVAAPRPVNGTPCLHLDVDAAVTSYDRLVDALPGISVRYAIRANPHCELLAGLARHGCHFDVASPAEVVAALAAGAPADQLIYSNPIKKRDDLIVAAALGADHFVVDSIEETRKIAECAPGAAVLCRIVTSEAGSDEPLSQKYGCSTGQAIAILQVAAAHGLRPAGVSFDVGQQRDPAAWVAPIKAAARIFAELRAVGLAPWLLDLGGGLPAPGEEATDGSVYATTIEQALSEAFTQERPQILATAGRAIVADAGTLEASVIAVVNRGGARWAYLDAGVFTGLLAALGDGVRFRVSTSADTRGAETGPCVLAGPTCDSDDVLYRQQTVDLPLELREGDRVLLHAAGAYTSCYSTASFNGFQALRTRLGAIAP